MEYLYHHHHTIACILCIYLSVAGLFRVMVLYITEYTHYSYFITRTMALVPHCLTWLHYCACLEYIVLLGKCKWFFCVQTVHSMDIP